MTTKQLAYKALPTIAVGVGATSPNPGIAGVQVWSTTTSTVLVWNGTSWQVAPFPSQSANTVLAAPNGAAGTPAFRALVAADIPTLNQDTTGLSRGLSVPDNRAVNDQPQGKLGWAITADFKDNSAVDSPPVTSTANYSHIMTVAGWSSAGGGGGWPAQVSFGDGMAIRQGTSATDWGSWRTVLHSNNFNSYSPTLTGTGASGTWAIDVSGRARVVYQSGHSDTHPAVVMNSAGAYYGHIAESAGQTWGLGWGSGVGTSTNFALTWTAAGAVNIPNTLTRGGNVVLDASNFNSYSPTLTGTGASGTWSISVSGNAATASSVGWSGVTSKPDYLVYYQGFVLDANTMGSNATGFTYALNAPYTGPITRFGGGANGEYDLWLNAPYNGGNGLAFRTMNGDIDTLNPWRTVLHDGNYNSYVPTLTGTGASGTWNIAVSGNAATATTLQTARTINGVSFNGGSNVMVPSLYDSNYRRITNPGGGEYTGAPSGTTGALAIVLPVGMTNTMVRMTIKVYVYGPNQSFDLHCGGYNYPVGNTWINSFAYIVANPDADRRYNVRFGYDSVADKAIVYIGELGTVWEYPQVFVTDVECGYSGYSASWVSGWVVGVEPTAFKGVTATVSYAQVGFRATTNVGYAVVQRDGSGNFSAGTITATLAGNAATATTFSTTRTTYFGVTDSAVTGQLMWKNYGNGHTIFDASNSTAPDGSSVSNTNSAQPWAATYPTLMGWNGAGTYGVRVDSARVSDSAPWSGVSGKPTTLGGYGITDAISTAGGNIGGVLRVSHTGSTTSYVDAGFEVITTDNTPPGISFHRAGYSATLLYENNGELYANAWVARSQSGKLVSSGNYNEYSPSLTGTGASGTWGINISGNAATVTNGVTTSNIGSYAQAPLVSGTNIKTVNGTSLLGSGDVAVSAAYVNRGAFRWVTTTATTFTVPAGVTSIRAYAIGGGGDGFRSLTQSLAGGGGGGGMAFGDIAVTPGASVTIGIASKVATVTYGGTTMLTANPGATATSGVRGTGGTAAKHASVTNGGAYTGGSGATGSQGAGGGGGATPLGAGTTATDYAGAGLAKGGVNTDGGWYWGGGEGSGGVNRHTVGGPARGLQSAYTDFLLRGALGRGGSFVSGSITGESGGQGGGGAAVYGTTVAAVIGGAGGDFGGGGSAYTTAANSSASARGGAGGFLGGGGGASASNVTPYSWGGVGGIGGGGGGVGSTNLGGAGTGGDAAVVIFY